MVKGNIRLLLFTESRSVLLILGFRVRQDLVVAEECVQQSKVRDLICPHGSNIKWANI